MGPANSAATARRREAFSIRRALFPSGSAALVPARDAGADRRVRRKLLPVLRGHGPGAARALGGMGVPLRAGRSGGASLLAFGRPGFSAKGLLRGAQPAVHGDQEFSRAHAGAMRLGPRLRAISGTRFRYSEAAEKPRSFVRQGNPRRCCRFWYCARTWPPWCVCPRCCASADAFSESQRISHQEFRRLLSAAFDFRAARWRHCEAAASC